MDHISNAFKAVGKNKVAEIRNLLKNLKLRSPFSFLYLQIKFKTCLTLAYLSKVFHVTWLRRRWGYSFSSPFGCATDCNLNFIKVCGGEEGGLETKH